MEQKKTAEEAMVYMERVLRRYILADEIKLHDSGFYENDIDAPLTSLQHDLLLQLEAYERILIEVLHMQGKKYWLEEVAEIIASQREGRENKLASMQAKTI